MALEARHRLERARALFADVAAQEDVPARLGTVLLRPDQIETARRVRDHVRRDGGCLLADDVGTGKTYVALAVARDWTRPLVVAPASLRYTWEQAARRANVSVQLVSHESLSRGRLPQEGFDAIIVDESHRFRATSRRYDALARLASNAPVLMLSATPMQNRVRELAAQLALFLGELAFGLESDSLARWIVRSSAPSGIPLPRVAPPRWIAVDGDDETVLHAILALPPPPRAADAGDGGVLLQLSLVRAWASSRAALVATVRRRRRILAAIEQCHAHGRLPTRRELRSWNGDGGVQLGFPTLLAATVVDRHRADALAAAVERERAALDALAQTIDSGDDPDLARVAALRALRAEHAGAPVLAFSEWASTVRAYWAGFRGDPGVGSLTASERRIASGRIARDELLARFAPRGQGAPSPPAHERVTLLISTDLLSEGVNLQDASVVVHLDLPWNPARLAQRLGRIRRPGGAPEVASYLLAPPAHASVLLQAEARLRAKLARAERTIGRGIAVLPALALAEEHDGTSGGHQWGSGEPVALLSAAELRSEITRRLASWHQAEVTARRSEGERVAIAAVEAETSGWIALLDDGRLVAHNRREDASVHPSEAAGEVVQAITAAGGAPRCADRGERDTALGALDQWLLLDWTHRSCGLAAPDSPLRRRVLRALDLALRETPRHRRAAMLGRVARLKHALALPLPLGVERALEALVDEASPGGDWIEQAAALVEGTPTRSRESGTRGPAMLRALILFGRGDVPTPEPPDGEEACLPSSP